MATDIQVARKIVSVNPTTGEILREFDAATDADVHAAVASARAAQPAWNALGVLRRVSVLREFQRLLHEKKSEIATLITRETGKPVVEALLTEVMVVLDATRCCIENVFLAGDWTRTGWPATMEGAVRSGYLAAEAVLAAAGTPSQFLQPDLPAEGFSARWARNGAKK